MLFLVALVSTVACKKDDSSAKQDEPAAATDDQAEPPAEKPAEDQATQTGTARVVDIEVKKDGYHPSSTEAKAGEALTLRFTRTEETECGGEIIVGEEKRELPLNEAVAFDITMPGDGELVYTCGMEMMQGKVAVVTE